MTTSLAPPPATTVDERVDTLLLTRGLVVVEPGQPVRAVSTQRGFRQLLRRRRSAPPAPTTEQGLVALEADLADRGHVLGADLRAGLADLGPEALGAVGRELLARLETQLGAAVSHVPLFRDFPASTPDDTEALWVDRVLTLLVQEPEQPCVLCGTVGSVHAVKPCAHLVCRVCFDGSDYSACPICRRRIDLEDPFLRPAAPRETTQESRRSPLRRLALAPDRSHAVAVELARLASRSAAPSRSDLDAVAVLVEFSIERCGGDLSWVPDEVPARTTKAVLVAGLLAHPAAREAAGPVLDRLLGTATDVLRVVTVLTGGQADLTAIRVRVGPVPRPVRRVLLARLDQLPLTFAAEDVLRHVSLWKKMAERLHPFESAHRFPRAALLLALARNTRLSVLDDSLRGQLEATAADTDGAFRVVDDRVRLVTWGGRTEDALAAQDLDRALALLARRPGELFRRLDHLLVLAVAASGDGAASVTTVVEAAQQAAPMVAPAVLVAARGEICGRDAHGERRVFFPAAPAGVIHTQVDRRDPLPTDVVAAAVATIDTELLARAGRLPPRPVAVLDDMLQHVPVPFATRSSSSALVEVPRGAILPLPQADVLRLFLHWTEPVGTRVDLDLSVAFFDAGWRSLGRCDYTQMRFGHDAAVHSGDLTSAPPPLGASEFVDLDLRRLTEREVAYAVPVVFSYNDVPFDQMDDAFAGCMVRTAEAARAGAHFDMRTVEQRFDLASQAKIAGPMVVDLVTGSLCWLDVRLTATGYGHDLAGFSSRVSHLGSALVAYFAAGRRTSMWQLGLWHAAGRAQRVAVRRGTGTTDWYDRSSGETVASFAARIGDPARADRRGDGLGPATRSGPVLATLLVGDLDLDVGSTAYALFPARLDAATTEVVTGTDMLSALAADDRPRDDPRPV